jgi:hypothetical protein
VNATTASALLNPIVGLTVIIMTPDPVHTIEINGQGSELRLMNDNTPFMFDMFLVLMVILRRSMHVLMFTMNQPRNMMLTILNLSSEP